MNDSPGRDTAALVLLSLALIGGVVELFYLPFGIGPIAFLAALIGIAISDKRRRFGLYTTGTITLCFLIGTSIAVWYSNPLY